MTAPDQGGVLFGPFDAPETAAAPGQAARWWVCDGPLPPHGTGAKIIGPFASQELALEVRVYVERAANRSDLWVDDEEQPQDGECQSCAGRGCPRCDSRQPAAQERPAPGQCPGCGSQEQAERGYVPGFTGQPVSCGAEWHEQERPAAEPGPHRHAFAAADCACDPSCGCWQRSLAPQPAPDLGTAWRIVDELRAKLAVTVTELAVSETERNDLRRALDERNAQLHGLLARFTVQGEDTDVFVSEGDVLCVIDDDTLVSMYRDAGYPVRDDLSHLEGQ